VKCRFTIPISKWLLRKWQATLSNFRGHLSVTLRKWWVSWNLCGSAGEFLW